MARKKIPVVKGEVPDTFDREDLDFILQLVSGGPKGIVDLAKDLGDWGVGYLRRSISWLRANGYLVAEGNTRAMKYRLA